MTSKPNIKLQKKRNEALYYELIQKSLSIIMGNYLDREKGYHPQRGLSINEPERVYLEIIGGKNVFSEKLKQVF